jgi:hypothetical protein
MPDGVLAASQESVRTHFTNGRSTSLTKSDATYLYLLWHETDGVFKLGKANDVHARMRSLPDAIDVKRSQHILVPNAALANRLEKLCHVLFKEQARPRPHHGAGYTEWFDGAVYEQVVAFLESNRVVMGCGPLSPIPPKVVVQVGTVDDDPVKVLRREDRERRRLENAQRHDVERQQFNAQALKTALEWLRAIENKSTIIGWFDRTFVVWADPEWEQFRSLGQLHHFFAQGRVFSMFESCSSTGSGLVLYECGGGKGWMRGRCARWGLPELEPLERMLIDAPLVPSACIEDLQSLDFVSFYDEMHASEDERRELGVHREKVTSRVLAEVMEYRKPVPDFEQYCIEMA